MTGDWLAHWPAFVAAFAVVFIPGLALGFVLRLRGLALWALAPVASTVLLASLALVLGLVGIPWSPLSIALGCLAVILLVALATIPLGRSERTEPGGASWALGLGLLIGILVGAARVILYVEAPDAISQSNDAVFHLNALRFIVESGSASSLDVGGVVGGAGFYPAAWHALASATMLFSGATIPVAANMVTLVTATVVWSLGIAWLTREAAGSNAAGAAAAALSPALLTFPMLLVQWGVLYPNLLSTALLPAAATLVIVAPRWIAGAGPVAGRAGNAVLVALLIVGALGALALAQPATILAWLIIAVCFVTWWSIHRMPSARGSVRAGLAVVILATWLGAAAVWVLLSSSTSGSHWPPFRGDDKQLAVVDAVFNGQLMLPFAVPISILMLVGLVVAVWRWQLRWLATVWLAFGALYVVTATIGEPTLRAWIVGGWYADPYRIAALAPIAVIPLAAIGLASIVGWAIGAIWRKPTDGGERAAVAWTSAGIAGAVVVAMFVLSPVVLMPKVIEQEWDEQSRYAMSADSWLSPDERALLERLDTLVPGGARVIANPSTGSGFGYMLSGVDVYPRTWSHPASEEWKVIQERLRDADADPAVCAALATYDSPQYVLDFGIGEATPGRYVLPGMTDFDGQFGFEYVDSQGDASLWRISACE